MIHIIKIFLLDVRKELEGNQMGDGSPVGSCTGYHFSCNAMEKKVNKEMACTHTRLLRPYFFF
jgi:hypothetical protein